MAERNTDEQLISRIQTKQCDTSIKELINRHSDLFYSICNKTSPIVLRQEVYRDKHFVIYKAATSFKSSKKVKFSTWLGNITKYHCLNYTKKESKYIESDEATKTFFFNSVSAEQYQKKILNEKIDHIFSLLSTLRDKRIVEIFKLRYLSPEKLTWKKIAKEFKLTPQTIITLHSKGRNFLKNKLDAQPD
jgi:RNA polymerase sigma factor (sigma-70 family)